MHKKFRVPRHSERDTGAEGKGELPQTPTCKRFFIKKQRKMEYSEKEDRRKIKKKRPRWETSSIHGVFDSMGPQNKGKGAKS